MAGPELSSSTIDPEAIIEVDDGQALVLLYYLGYYKECCDEHRGTFILLN